MTWGTLQARPRQLTCTKRSMMFFPTRTAPLEGTKTAARRQPTGFARVRLWGPRAPPSATQRLTLCKRDTNDMTCREHLRNALHIQRARQAGALHGARKSASSRGLQAPRRKSSPQFPHFIVADRASTRTMVPRALGSAVPFRGHRTFRDTGSSVSSRRMTPQRSASHAVGERAPRKNAATRQRPKQRSCALA